MKGVRPGKAGASPSLFSVVYNKVLFPEPSKTQFLVSFLFLSLSPNDTELSEASKALSFLNFVTGNFVI